ncbi:MAG TPA: hypothetical protein VLX29_03685 [Nitrospirota bacterium]|nr:hypothetical protein [Nitrospirota bacterium]
MTLSFSIIFLRAYRCFRGIHGEIGNEFMEQAISEIGLENQAAIPERRIVAFHGGHYFNTPPSRGKKIKI